MIYLTFDIPEGTSVGDFLGDISCHNNIKPQAIVTLIQESLASGDYYIRTYPVDGKGGKVGLKDLTSDDVAALLGGSEIGKKGQDLINPESMIFKHRS